MEGSKSSSSTTTTATMQVSFVCQRCSQPLKLDTSFNVLDRVTIQELIGGSRMSESDKSWSTPPSDVVHIDHYHFPPFPFLSFFLAAPLVTVTPSKQTDSQEEGDGAAPEVGAEV